MNRLPTRTSAPSRSAAAACTWCSSSTIRTPSSIRRLRPALLPSVPCATSPTAGASVACVDPFGHHWEIGKPSRRADGTGSKAVKAPETIETERLLLRRPKQSDAQAVFHRYASDRDVTRYLSWPTHRSVADTLAFLAMSDDEWRRWPAGPYLVLTRDNGVRGSARGKHRPLLQGPHPRRHRLCLRKRRLGPGLCH